MKWYWWVGIILTVALISRHIFTSCYRGYRTSGDTVSYYLTGRLIVKTHRLSDPWRTPVYPLLMAAPYIIGGKEMPPMLLQGDFIPELWYLRIAQGIVGVATLVILFFLLREFTITPFIAGMFTVFSACSWIFMFAEYALTTEVFAMFFLVLSVLLVVMLLRKFSLWKYCLLAVLTIIQVFLRPSNIMLPLIYCGMLVWHHRTRVVVLAVTGLLIFYSVIMSAYIHANDVYAGYRGISRISDMNLLGKIFTYKLPFDNTPDEEGIKPLLEDYSVHSANPDPWPLFVQHTELYLEKYAMPLHRMVMGVIKNNVGNYIVRSLADIPHALLDKTILLDNFTEDTRLGPYITALGHVYISVQIIDLLLFIAVPLYFVRSLKKRTVRTDGLLLISVLGLYYVLIGTFLSYNDYTRLFSIAQPFMLFISGTLIVGGFRSLGTLIKRRFSL
jgi:hypothetical protein